MIQVTDLQINCLRQYTKKWGDDNRVGFNKVASFYDRGLPALLVWVFNDQHELFRLLDDLTPHCSVLALRSFHLVVAEERKSFSLDKALARFYYSEIASTLQKANPESLFVGGNCQASPVAHHLCHLLTDAGFAVNRFFQLDCIQTPPLSVPVTQFYGCNSIQYNPLLRRDICQLFMAPGLYPDFRFKILSSKHGSYFSVSKDGVCEFTNSLAEDIKASRLGRDCTVAWPQFKYIESLHFSGCCQDFSYSADLHAADYFLVYFYFENYMPNSYEIRFYSSGCDSSSTFFSFLNLPCRVKHALERGQKVFADIYHSPVLPGGINHCNHRLVSDLSLGLVQCYDSIEPQNLASALFSLGMIIGISFGYIKVEEMFSKGLGDDSGRPGGT